MAFDGFVISNLVHNFKKYLVGGRIIKISQPEKDELILTIKNYNTYKLDISVSASLPLIYFTEESKPAPLTAPGFCMLLRKHLNSARILDVVQPEMERVIQFKIEHLDEMGDLKTKWLIVELMGKHSNIIFADDTMKIIDSIKHISQFVSSVREVLPGREYFIPKTSEKKDATFLSQTEFTANLKTKNCDIFKALYTSFNGFSPLISNEICYRAGIDASTNTSLLSDNDFSSIYEITSLLTRSTLTGDFEPVIIFNGEHPLEFSCFKLRMFDNSAYTTSSYNDISQVISSFYSMKDKVSRINQKSATLRKSVSTAIERVSKKYDLQLAQLKSTEKRDKYKVYGELITTYGYNVPEGSKTLTCINYYDGNEITIPLDDTIPVMANAKKYFDRYSKLKRTHDTVSELINQTKDELFHLKSIQNSLDMALYENDLAEIRNELADFGYIRKASSTKDRKTKKEKFISKPLHYQTPDGYDLYVGKNNYQNDELTFKFANGNDWWFHAKNAPGSHVILKTDDKEFPDRVYEQAASLAAFYSSLRDNGKVEIDYLQRKNVKKPNSAKPGFVVYYTNYSLMAVPDISELTLID